MFFDVFCTSLNLPFFFLKFPALYSCQNDAHWGPWFAAGRFFIFAACDVDVAPKPHSADLEEQDNEPLNWMKSL